MALFLIQFQGKRLCPLSGHDLSKLLEIGALRGQDPLYSYRDKQWFYIDEFTGFAKYYDDTPRSERKTLPNFTPPPLDSLQIMTLTEVKESVKEVIKEVVVEKEIPAPERIIEHYIEPDPDTYVEKAQYQHLYQEHNALREELFMLQAKLADHQGQNEKLKSQCDQYFLELHKAKSQLLDLSTSATQIQSFNEQIQQERKKHESLTFTVLDLKEELMMERLKSGEYERDNKEFSTLRIKLEHELESLKRENQSLKLFLERSSPEAIASNEHKLQQFDKIKKQYEDLRQTLQNKNIQLSELEAELAEVKKIDRSEIEREITKEIRQEYHLKWQSEQERILGETVRHESTLKENLNKEKRELLLELNQSKRELEETHERLNDALDKLSHNTFNEEAIQDLKAQLSDQYQREIGDYKELLRRRELEITELNSKVLEFESQVQEYELLQKSSSDKDERTEQALALLDHEKKISRQLKLQLKDIKQKLSDKEAQYSALAKQGHSQQQNDEAIKKGLASAQKQIHKLQSDNDILKQKFNKAIIQIQKYKLKIESASDIIDKLKSKSKVKNEEIVKLKTEMQKLADTPTQLINMKEVGLKLQSEKTRPKIVRAPDDSSTDNYSDEELAKLIGDSFEVPNLPEWKIKTQDGIQGPYTYSEMLELKGKKQIDEKVLIKKKAEGSWKLLKEFFELTTEVITHRTKIDGAEVTKYYIKRGSFRAPFYEVCSFDLQGNEVRGHCTSLSIGGAFIELNRVDDPDSLREKKIFLRFSKGALSAPFGVQAIIKNVSDARPKGIGVMFVALPEHGKDAIIEYINLYLEKLSSGAA